MYGVRDMGGMKMVMVAVHHHHHPHTPSPLPRRRDREQEDDERQDIAAVAEGKGGVKEDRFAECVCMQ